MTELRRLKRAWVAAVFAAAFSFTAWPISAVAQSEDPGQKSQDRAANDHSPSGENEAHHKTATAIFAGGCFWCMEAPFDAVDGVLDTTSGYTGGHVENPTYE